MITAAFLILAAAVLWQILPELRHLDRIEAAWTPEDGVAAPLAGGRAPSSDARRALTGTAPAPGADFGSES